MENLIFEINLDENIYQNMIMPHQYHLLLYFKELIIIKDIQMKLYIQNGFNIKIFL